MFSSRKEVYKYMVYIGVICNVLTLLVTLFSKDAILFSFTLTILILSIVGYGISFFTKTNAGVHIMLISYLVIFTAASFTHLVRYPLILVYPIVFGFSLLTLNPGRSRIMYSILCSLGCVITIFLEHLYIFESNYLDILSSSIIGLGLLLAFFTLSIFHLELLRKFQDDLIFTQDGLEEKNLELEKYIESNLQLENFAHLASHELKTPIKNISNFSGLLKLKLQNRIDKDEREIIDHINREVKNINNLITDLLDLSQATNQKLAFSTFSTQGFFKELISQYFKDYQEHIFLNIMPEKITAHEKLLQQVFINLIGNAIKFRDKNRILSIKISIVEDQNNFYFTIDDNGIGIKDEVKDKIFLIFKRLHSGAEYEGTGIGLAITKKIVSRHGGMINVDTNEEGGARFKFNFSKELMKNSSNPSAAKIMKIRG